MMTVYELEKQKIENGMNRKDRKRIKMISKLFKIPVSHILDNITYDVEMGFTISESIGILERILKVGR